jgi:chemotaxis protein methyltransferase CheR
MNGLQTGQGNESQKFPLREFQLIRRMVYDQVGIDLEGKEVLVSARLGKKMRELGLSSFKKYYEFVQRDTSGEAMTAMVEALTTNHTSFFREPQHFDYLRKVIVPELKPTQEVRIWSAACSTGEEPYSIAFTMVEEMGEAAFSKVRILATDISTRVLATAEQGLYPASRFRDIPVDRLRRHVLKGSACADHRYLVKRQTRSLISFQRLNLMEDFSRAGLFSVIFCRNVMIYFDQPTQQNLVNRLAAQLEPGG